MKVLSLGAGVQSSTLALMAARDEFERPDFAIFADTGAEPASVYRHLDWLETHLPFPVYRVSRGDLRADCLSNVVGEQTGKRSTIPAFVANSSGDPALLMRQCTRDYKIDPIIKKLRELRNGKQPVEQWIGISTDEAHRMKPSQKAWITHRWPLIERSFSRATCLQWLAERQYPRPPKSACVFCPYRSATGWRDMRDNEPDAWRAAVEFDKAIRPGFQGSPSQAFLHRSLKPLDEVDLRTWSERGQPDLFGQECDGMCGV